MSRKPKRGYYVKGQFVHEGSELDLELKRELKGDTDISRTDLKRHSDELQDLGGELLTLRADLMAKLTLPEKLQDALAEAKRLTNFEAKRRQMQFIGKLMRKLDDEEVQAIQQVLQIQRDGGAADAAILHQAEQWRDRLIDSQTGDAALTEWLSAYADTDIQAFRALIRQARKDVLANQTQSRTFKELFQSIKTQLLSTTV